MKLWNFKGFPKGNKLQFRHGMTDTRTWRSWSDMKRRCLSPQRKEYARYGGRGINVCERWMKFDLFLEDMGPCPPGMELDRKNTNGNYEPDNCRWATETEQQNNKRSNVLVTVGEIVLTIANWARLTGVPRKCIEQRIRAGVAPAIAVISPSNRGKKLCG